MSTPKAKAEAVDPVTVEVIRNGLLAVTEEMKTNLTADRLQSNYLRSPGLHRWPFHSQRRHGLDWPRPSDVYSWDGGNGQSQD